jgi:long-chain acyl-CoA synthetase
MNAALLSKKKQAYYVLMRWFDPKEVLSMIEKYRITHFSGVPAMYRMLLNHPDFNHYDLSSLESCSIASAPVTEELYKAFTTKFNCTMSEVYGLTEAVAVVTISRADMPRKQGSSGVPLPGVELRIVDAEDKELPPYEQGEITVKGPNVMKGYYKNPEETKEALRGGWLHTGDIGYVDEEGSLYVTDRKKDMIIKGGYNIYPSEIEKYILEHPVVREVGVVGVPHEKYGEDVFAFAVLKDGKKISERELIDYIQSRISKFKAPSRIEFVDDLPKNLVGKIQKQELKKMAKRIVS